MLFGQMPVAPISGSECVDVSTCPYGEHNDGSILDIYMDGALLFSGDPRDPSSLQRSSCSDHKMTNCVPFLMVSDFGFCEVCITTVGAHIF